MRYLIIGLGIYGSNLARDLTAMGHEIIGVDNRRQNIDALKDYISATYLIDSTDEGALALLPLNNVDLAIVAIGENFGASIKTVALLKKLGVRHIYARAIDKLHLSILESFELDRIVTPEQRAAADLSHEMSLGTHVQTLRIDHDHYVMRFAAPKLFVGLLYSDLKLETAYHLRLIAATRPVRRANIMGIAHDEDERLDISAPGTEVREGDVLVCMGSKRAFASLYRQSSAMN